MEKSLINKISSAEQTVSRNESELSFLATQMHNIDNEMRALSQQEATLKKAAAFCDFLIEKLNQSSIEDIEKLVSEALQFIFGKPYNFKMNPKLTRGHMTYRFSLEVDGHEEEDIMNAQGGGVICIISVLMRIVTILISKNMRRFLLLDESLGMLSDEFIDNASKFIKDLGSKLGFEIVLITHQEQFMQHADVVYRVEGGKVTKL